jgi:hypothetical protein
VWTICWPSTFRPDGARARKTWPEQRFPRTSAYAPIGEVLLGDLAAALPHGPRIEEAEDADLTAYR